MGSLNMFFPLYIAQCARLVPGRNRSSFQKMNLQANELEHEATGRLHKFVTRAIRHTRFFDAPCVLQMCLVEIKYATALAQYKEPHVKALAGLCPGGGERDISNS